jgi:hypothetical protein
MYHPDTHIVREGFLGIAKVIQTAEVALKEFLRTYETLIKFR